MLSKQRYSEIEREVFYMLEECGIDVFPIDPFEIARRLGYHVTPYSELEPEKFEDVYDESADGCSEYLLNDATGMYEYHIYYNDIDFGKKHQRWTVLHEIGHIYLGHHDMDISYERAESEANYFAKYSIAPYPLINHAKCEDPWEISDTFNVSWEASVYIYESFQKWMVYGPPEYVENEKKILALFHVAA